MKLNKTLIVVKRSALERISSRQKLDSSNASYKSLKTAARNHGSAFTAVKGFLKDRGIKFDIVKRLGLPRIKKPPESYDLVITIGGDGTLLNASHFVKSVPMLGVNSAPESSVGLLCGAFAQNFGAVLDEIVTGSVKPISLQRVQAYVGRKLLGPPALNEILFANSAPPATTRYKMTFRGRCQVQKSSGVWVSTAAGSTAVVYAVGAKVLPIESRNLQFIVRELYPDKSFKGITGGTIKPGEKLELYSTTIDGTLYVDGQTTPYDVPFGKTLTFKLSPNPITLMGYNREKRNKLIDNHA